MTLDVVDHAGAAARAAALLDDAAAGRAGLAAWTFAPPALVLGSAQRDDTVDAEALARAGLALGRRGTGGGAVICDGGLLEVDVALPAGDPRADADVTAAYRWLGEAWQAALAAVGVPTLLVADGAAREQPDARRAAARLACWAGLSPSEVVLADGRKLVGLAQRRRRGAVLFQSALACAGSPARVRALVRADDPGVSAALDRELARTVTLGELVPTLATPGAAWQALGPALRAAAAC